MKNFCLFFVVMLPLFWSCTGSETEKSAGFRESTLPRARAKGLGVRKSYRKGDIVPHDQVCMVNDAFMGKKQIEVDHNGKQYYGCCEMCEKRIPQDEGVRVALDPVSGKQVDKAEAVIAITGEDGEVSYFENDANFKTFFKQ